FKLRDATSQKLTNFYGTKILTGPKPQFFYHSINYGEERNTNICVRSFPVSRGRGPREHAVSFSRCFRARQVSLFPCCQIVGAVRGLSCGSIRIDQCTSPSQLVATTRAQGLSLPLRKL